MKIFSPVLLTCLLTVPAFAQDAKSNAAPDLRKIDSAEVHTIGRAFSVAAGVVRAPFVLTNGYISQSVQNDVTTDGKAIYNFTITNAGDYLIKASVNAPDESANSFYVNIDADPEDPAMIWDIDPTSGFEERTVSWRGGGTAESDEFAPKRFTLTAGAHKLIIVGREVDTQLKTLTIVPAPAVPAAKEAEKK